MRKKYVLAFAFLFSILLCTGAYASTIGVSPSIIRFNKMIKGGYAESAVQVSTSIEYDVGATFSKDGEIADWISLEPDKERIVFSNKNPNSFLLIVQPPEDAQNGNYSGRLIITTDELATVDRGAGSSVIAQIALLIYVEVVGEEIITCQAGAVSTGNSEANMPFTIRATVLNEGNVRLRPEIKIDVYDQYRATLVLSKTLIGDQILPTKNKEIIKQVENSLPVGQYFADIYIRECGFSRQTTFDILEKGQIADSGRLIAIGTNEISYAKEPLPIVPLFQNMGSRKVVAKFKGEIKDLRTNKLVQVLESDSLEVDPGGTTEFRMFFIPEIEGQYQISGRVIYNNKITFEEQSKVVQIVKSGFSFRPGIILTLLVYFIIGLVILILIGKIRKEKKKKRRY